MLDKGVAVALGALVIFAVLGMMGTEIVSSTSVQTCATAGSITFVDGSTGTGANGAKVVGVDAIKGTGAAASVESFYPAGQLCAIAAVTVPTTAITIDDTTDSQLYLASTGTNGKAAGSLAYKFGTIKSLISLIPIGIIVFMLMAGFDMYRKK